MNVLIVYYSTYGNVYKMATRAITPQEAAICRALGHRLADLGQRLSRT